MSNLGGEDWGWVLRAWCDVHREPVMTVGLCPGLVYILSLSWPAGVTATVTCFPLDVMRTRVMGPGGHVYGGVISTFRNLLQKEGISSLYVGLLPAVISMAPAGAVFYGVYDLLKVKHLLHTTLCNMYMMISCCLPVNDVVWHARRALQGQRPIHQLHSS